MIKRVPHHNQNGTARRNTAYHETIIRNERRTSIPIIPTQAKCPTCGKIHTVELSTEQIDPGEVQRIYCDKHTHNRAFDGNIFSLAGNIMMNGGRHGAHA